MMLASLLLVCLLTQWANSIDLPSLGRLLGSFDYYVGSLFHGDQSLSLTVLTGDASEGTCNYMRSLTVLYCTVL